MKEVKEKRGKYNKTYSDDNKHFITSIFNSPIHYKNSNNEWDDIKIYLYSKPNKWLVEKNNVTVGFRKDKKLYKYAGFRYDENHQFENTFNSIKFDGEEQLTGSTGFTNIEKESDNTISHYLNDLRIFNEVYKTYFRNYVEVQNIISGFTCNEEFHLKNLYFANELTNIETGITNSGITDSGETWFETGITYGKFIPNNRNEFYIIDENNNFKFKIPNPLIKDNNNDKIIENIDHELYLSGGNYIYQKDANNLEILEFPLFIDSAIDFESENYDGYIVASGSSWRPVSTEVDIIEQGSEQLKVRSQEDTGLFILSRSFLYFDLKNFFLNPIINYNNHKLKLFTEQNLDSYHICVQEGTQHDSLIEDDYDAFTSPIFDHKEVNDNDYTNFDISSYDIKINELNKFCIREYNYDYENTTPNDDTEHGATIHSSESNYPPYLTFEYKELDVDCFTFRPFYDDFNNSISKWFINSGDDLTDSLSEYNGINIFSLDYLSGDTIESGFTQDKEYIDIIIDKNDYPTKNELLLLTKLEDIIEVEISGETILSGETIYKIINDNENDKIKIRYLKEELTNSSISTGETEEIYVSFKNRYRYNNENGNYEYIGGFLYENLKYEDIDGTDYTTLKLDKELIWDRTFFVDNVFKISGFEWNNGDYKGGLFSGYWKGGRWVRGTWEGYNANTGDLTKPQQAQPNRVYNRKNFPKF